MTYPMPHMPGVRPREQTLFITDFSEYTVGAQPHDMTRVWAQTFTALVQTVAGSISGKALRWTKTAADRQGLSWDKVPPAADVEVLIGFRIIEAASGSDIFVYSMMRGAGALGTETAYRVPIYYYAATGWQTNGGKRVNGVSTNFTPAYSLPGSPSFAVNQWAWQRTRMVGTQLQAKAWQRDRDEANHNFISYTDASITAAGWSGLAADSANPNVEVDYLAVSLGAPGRPPATIPLPV